MHDYVAHLEDLINDKLLPVYNKYYKLIGKQAPALPKLPSKKTCALVQKKVLESKSKQ